MVVVSYVYPNTSELAQRGGLKERWELATGMQCKYVEIPADFIKNKTETDKTGLSLGDFLTEEAIAVLYTKEENTPEQAKYILHTEPSLPRNDGYGVLHQAALNWRQISWVENFVKMVINISKFFGTPAAGIEIHPGDRRNSFDDIAVSIGHLLIRYNEVFGVEPVVLLENRSRQIVSSGEEILGFWTFLLKKHCDLKPNVGIVLDVQQLYTVAKGSFSRQLDMIPSDALKGVHIHCKHRAPDLSDEIPWKPVFQKIADIGGNVLINPEIHHKAKVKQTIDFCEKMICQMQLPNTRT